MKNELFDNLKCNSIGIDKEVKNVRVKKIVDKSTHTICVLTMAMACLTGCSVNKSVEAESVKII